jgi:hypothetical protein
LADRSLTLRLRGDAFLRHADKQRAADAAVAFLSDSFGWTRDEGSMQRLCGLLGLRDATSTDAMFKIKRAIETGDIVTMPDPPRHTGASSNGSGNSKPRSVTFTPAQLFRGAGRIGSAGSYVSRALPMLPAYDWLAMWNASPGDVLPDGTIATAFDDTKATALADALPIEYVPDEVSGDAEELAASTNNPRYAAKMLGYDQNTFSNMLHVFKPANGLGAADNVIFHDNGSVEFNGMILDDNIHDYAP